MAFKQPIVPPMREGNQLIASLRDLFVFLRDFCLECWMESRRQERELNALRAEIEKIKEAMNE